MRDTKKRDTNIFLFLFSIIIILIAGFTFFISGNVVLDFLSPSPADGITTTNNSLEINLNIDELNLKNISFSLDSEDYLIYDPSLILVMNFENNSEIGENYTLETENLIADGSSYRHNGTLYAGEDNTNYVLGKHGNAFEFDGLNDFINMSSLDDSDFIVNFTILGWIKLKSYKNITHYSNGIFSKRDATEDGGFSLEVGKGVYGYKERLYMTYYNQSGSRNSDLMSESLSLNKWYHIGIMSNDTNFAIFLNGEISNMTNDGGVMQVPYDFLIGDGAIHTDNRNFNGTIDSVMIWNRSLSENEIGQIYYSNIKRVNNSLVNLNINRTDITNGTHSYTLRSCNNLDECSSSSKTISFSDITGPELEITNLTLYYQDVFNIKFNATDNNNISSWHINDSRFLISSNGHFSNNSLLEIGTYFVNISAEDVLGNSNSQVIKVEIIDWCLMPTTWELQQKVPGSLDKVNYKFGFSTSVDENYAVIGAPWTAGTLEYSGAAYVYEKSSNGTWTELQELIPEEEIYWDEFGQSVYIKNNSIFIVSNSGIFAFEKNSSGYWEQKQKIEFETSHGKGEIFLHNDTYLIIGDSQNPNMPLPNSGIISIYIKNSSGYWERNFSIWHEDQQARDYFGGRVYRSGNYLFSEANKDSNSGAVYIFKFENNGSWSQIDKIVPSDTQTNSYFGSNIDSSGKDFLISAHGYNNATDGDLGAAYIFEMNSSGGLTQKQKLLASDGLRYDYFGTRSEIVGDYMVLGAYGDDDPEKGDYSGSVYIFSRNSSDLWEESQKISEGRYHHYFGFDLSFDGETLLVGAYGEGTYGSAYFYNFKGLNFKEISNEQFGEDYQTNFDIGTIDFRGIDSITINDTTNFEIDGNTITNKTALPLGIYNLNISINNTCGDSISKEIFVEVSGIGPILEVSNIVMYENAPLSVQFNASDNQGVDSWVINDTINFEISGSGVLSNFTNLSAGRYWINIGANDSRGTYNYQDILVNVVSLTPTFSSFGGSTTNFTDEGDFNSISNAILEKNNYGKIYFNRTLNFTGLDLNSYVYIENNLIGIDSNELSALNFSAILTMYNISYISPVVLRDGLTCDDCSIFNHTGNNVSFTVEHFSNYSLEEGLYCGDGVCNNGETCGGCPSDCGGCTSSGGGGSGASVVNTNATSESSESVSEISNSTKDNLASLTAEEEKEKSSNRKYNYIIIFIVLIIITIVLVILGLLFLKKSD